MVGSGLATFSTPSAAKQTFYSPPYVSWVENEKGGEGKRTTTSIAPYGLRCSGNLMRDSHAVRKREDLPAPLQLPLTFGNQIPHADFFPLKKGRSRSRSFPFPFPPKSLKWDPRGEEGREVLDESSSENFGSPRRTQFRSGNDVTSDQNFKKSPVLSTRDARP